MADAAHEMRTPLTTINGLLEGLEYDAIPEDSKEESIRLMQRETKRLIRLVNDNLDYERIRTNKIKLDCQMVNLKQAVLRVVEQLGKKAEKENDQLIVEMNSDVVVYADPDRLIVHELVQIHGGEIEVSSAPGRGTTFKLHFPKAPADQ